MNPRSGILLFIRTSNLKRFLWRKASINYDLALLEQFPMGSLLLSFSGIPLQDAIETRRLAVGSPEKRATITGQPFLINKNFKDAAGYYLFKRSIAKDDTSSNLK
jgi:hypothetical protein